MTFHFGEVVRYRFCVCVISYSLPVLPLYHIDASPQCRNVTGYVITKITVSGVLLHINILFHALGHSSFENSKEVPRKSGDCSSLPVKKLVFQMNLGTFKNPLNIPKRGPVLLRTGVEIRTVSLEM